MLSLILINNCKWINCIKSINNYDFMKLGIHWITTNWNWIELYQSCHWLIRFLMVVNVYLC